MRNYKVEGVIIRRRNFGEADRILTVFTKEFGKIQTKAPGVRRINSRRSPHIELLNLCLLNLYKKSSSSFSLVTEATTIENFFDIKNDLRKTGYVYYICELVDGLCPENQENNKIFSLLKTVLYQLEDSKNCRKLVEDFEKELLVSLGFGSYPGIVENILERKLRTQRTLQLFQM